MYKFCSGPKNVARDKSLPSRGEESWETSHTWYLVVSIGRMQGRTMKGVLLWIG